MGIVYFGYQENLGRPVAIKMIRSGALAGPEEVQRFYAEARSAARLKHPNLVTVYQCGEIDGHHYFSMDFVDGTDLAQRIKDGPLSPEVAARYVRDAVRAIAYAHSQGVVHRDLKPANILVDPQDQVHITDFGLAKTLGTDSGLTQTGAALGTPSYMAPEQAAGRADEFGFAPDIYSLGAILFALVTGRPPFRGKTAMQTMMQVMHRPAPRARSLNPEVDPDLDTIIDVCLQKSPDRRYASAEALADDLERYLRGEPIHARPTPWFRRAWYWLLGVPILRALLDHRVEEPSLAHRWFQRGLIAFLVLPLIFGSLLLVASTWQAASMPRSAALAAGEPSGVYHRVARRLADDLASRTGARIQVIPTEGSVHNLELLLSKRCDLAITQAEAIATTNAAVVAPLYYEAVHLMGRADAPIVSLQDLKGRRVWMGKPKSGTRYVAQMILQFAGIQPEEVVRVDGSWQDPTVMSTCDAAFLVYKPGAPEIQALLQRGNMRLLPFPQAWQFSLRHPTFHPFLFEPGAYPGLDMPSQGIPTVATTAFLVARRDAPRGLIEHTLHCLYRPEVVRQLDLIPPETSAAWQNLPWHPDAHAFLQAYRGSFSVNQ
ncbi:MAG: TAXI family TRAP transporter solute-binding subunit [Planctomycetota bacterium]|nr:MAG: TAXI family TRAP transporter solute-binding subunit [Planctomycetota bacterium]